MRLEDPTGPVLRLGSWAGPRSVGCKGMMRALCLPTMPRRVSLSVRLSGLPELLFGVIVNVGNVRQELGIQVPLVVLLAGNYGRGETEVSPTASWRSWTRSPICSTHDAWSEP